MNVIKADGNVTLVFKEESPGFHRGTKLEYIAFSPEAALILADTLIKTAKELINERDTKASS